MKPAYEIVRAEELRVGDVIKENARDWLMTVAVVNTDERCVQVNYGPPFGFKTQVFRQLTPERNPDVLMRALEIATREWCESVFKLQTDEHRERQVSYRVAMHIGDAIREMESEAGK